MANFIGIGGLVLILSAAYAMSNNRKAIDFRLVAWGLGLQVAFAVFILKTAPGNAIFDFLSRTITAILGFAGTGAAFLFGPLVTDTDSFGLIVAFQVLPVIIFTAALFSVLYYLGVMQVVVQIFAKIVARTMGASGAESLAAAANIFVGMTDAPLVIRPFVSGMTQSEMMALMTGGMATIAGSVMAGYIQMGVSAGHLLTASVMAAPAGLLIAKILHPETETPRTHGELRMETREESINLIDAIVRGASDGLRLALNVGAMLIAFVALAALANGILSLAGVTLEQIFGYAFAPIAVVIGVPWADAMTVGNLLGQKVVLNEFVAYSSLTLMLADAPDALDPRSVVIVTYALAGFANFGSIGVMIGGISGIAPDRRQDLARLSMRSLMGGLMATLMTASIAGLLI